MKRHTTDEEAYQKTVRELTKILVSEKNIVFAYLHGSYRSKTNFGDIDIAIFLQNLPEKDFMFYEFDLEEVMQKITSYPIDIRILNTAPPSFCYSVIKNGCKLVEKDISKRVEFETITFKTYFDFLPFRQGYFREVLSNEK